MTISVLFELIMIWNLYRNQRLIVSSSLTNAAEAEDHRQMRILKHLSLPFSYQTWHKIAGNFI